MILRDLRIFKEFKGFQDFLMDFNGFLGFCDVLRKFERFQGILRDYKGV